MNVNTDVSNVDYLSKAKSSNGWGVRTFYDTRLNLGHLFLYLSREVQFIKYVLPLLPKIDFLNLALLLLYRTFVISFGISVKECKFTEFFIWYLPY